jgi:hypothetical protein
MEEYRTSLTGQEVATFLPPGRAGIVITSGVLQLQQCTLYAPHLVPVLQSHHVIPESWWVKAGKPVASPMRELCPNCHMAVHAAIDGILRGLDIHLLPPRSITLAQAGIDGANLAGLIPARTLLRS